MATEAELQAQLDQLDSMIAAGILSSSYEGRRLEFGSFKDLKDRRGFIYSLLLKAQSKTRVRTGRIYVKRDY